MTPREVTDFALQFPEATEDHPFGDTPHVYKVVDRIFALLSPDAEPPRVSLKCDPELAVLLREKYAGVTAGYHLNKRHWNTVLLDGSVPEDEIREMIDHSYGRVIAKLPVRTRERLLREPVPMGG